MPHFDIAILRSLVFLSRPELVCAKTCNVAYSVLSYPRATKDQGVLISSKGYSFAEQI